MRLSFEDFVDEVSEIADNVALVKAGGGSMLYGSFTSTVVDSSAANFLMASTQVRYTKSADSEPVFCNISFSTSTDGTKFLFGIKEASAGFEEAFRESLKEFLEKNKETVEMVPVETINIDIEKSQQNQREKVSRDEKLIELRAGKSSDVFNLWYCGVVMAICLAIIRAYFLSSQGAPVVPIVAGLIEIAGIVGIIELSRRLREKSEKIKTLTEAQEATGDNVQPGK